MRTLLEFFDDVVAEFLIHDTGCRSRAHWYGQVSPEALVGECWARALPAGRFADVED